MFWQTRVERLEGRHELRAILAILADPGDQPHERASAAKALADVATEIGELRAEAIAVLLRVADEPAAYVRRQALFALAELRAREALPAFRRAAVDPDFLIRVFAAHGFDRLADPDCVGEVIRLLRDRESQVREAAVSALARLGDARLRPLLEDAAVNDPYQLVRDSAKEALVTLDR
jgi:HEAT repeat protein